MIQAATGVLLSLAVTVLSYQLLRGILGGHARVVDLQLAEAVYRWRGPILTTTMTVITNLGATIPLTVAILLLVPVAWRRHRQEVAGFVVIFTMGVLINLLLKMMIHRPRPTVSPLIDISGYSFPSGHAMNSLVFYSTVAYFLYHATRRKLLRTAAVFVPAAIVFLIGLSRVYLGVHYPSDVIAGYVVGACWLAVAWWTSRSWAWAEVLGRRSAGSNRRGHRAD